MSTETMDRTQYELRYQSLSDAGRALAFQCDADGRVDLNALGRATFNDYLYARALVGRDFDFPCICSVAATTPISIPTLSSACTLYSA
ncbi:hypothetical protein VAR608DRAFT_1982 [Variovorax sp. HW608]|uniref:hypothetical protein n=1 Tax=Variovorax sp. HW608 TaxID=1034889 RepID=UPI0008200648|nr:hypothetical protein [Variovorax sp. HW608]SCK24859.1 hypothetical protein VAR608DRAFT_1982 [Variovorax sp. HW608]